MEGNAIEMGTWNNFEASVLDRGVTQIVRQEDDLRPGLAAHRVVPLHPVLVPV